MSRLFDGAGDRLVHAAAPVTAPPLTLACWVRRAVTGSTQYIMGVYEDGGTTNNHRILFAGANGIQASSTDSTSTSFAQASVTLTDTAGWHHVCGVFAAANSRAAYLDGGNKGTNGTNRNPVNLDTIKIGAGGTNAQVLSAYLAHPAIWNAALSDEEVAALGAGVSPLLIRPSALVAYWPFLGRDATEIEIIGRYALTVTGTSQSSEEPPARWISRRRIYLPATAAGGTNVELQGAAIAAASASADLSHAVPLQGAALASAVAAGSLSLQVNLAGDALVGALAAAQMAHGVPLAGDAVASANAAAVLSLTVGLSGDAVAQATAAGELAHHVPLSGDALAGAQGSASLQGTASLSGSAIAGAQGAGTLTLSVPLTAQAVASALATGALSVQVNLTGDAIAQALAGGELTVLANVQLQGSALVGASAAATLSVIDADFRAITRVGFKLRSRTTTLASRSRSLAFRLN